MKRARGKLILTPDKPRAPALDAALRRAKGGAHGKSEKARRRAAQVELKRRAAGDD